MKKYIFLILFLTNSFFVFAQNFVSEPTQNPGVNYRLFRTRNAWNFLKLETTTGRIWQVQFALGDAYEGEVIINNKNLAENKKIVPGRFTLYPTENTWTFILVDQIDGNIWHIQWAFDEENRFIMPMN